MASPEHPSSPPANDQPGQAHRSPAIDPVCGMTVDPGVAAARGLQSTVDGLEYFFCGRGCRLDFEEDPARYLDPGYVPSM
jgi:P-type Cu+ transporter